MNLDRDELHAWVDGRLDGERLLRFERELQADPDRLEQARAWRRQTEALRALGDSMLEEPVPEHLAAIVRSHAAAGPDAPSAAPARARPLSRDPRAWLAAAAFAAVAWSLGWLAHGHFESTLRVAGRQPPAFVRDAVAAYVVYSPEVRHPVEVAAAQHEHLVQWLSKRLGVALTIPSLDALGWSLVGGRLLPGADGARAQFMYQDASGARLTLYVANAGKSSQDTAFRFDSAGPVAAFYWVDGRFGYALSARTDRRTLLAIAEEVYRQLNVANTHDTR